jgi:site-specific recombinase XerD
MGKMEDFLSTIQSPQTRKSYTNGIRKFEEFLKRPIEKVLGSADAGKSVEKFFVWLKSNSYTQNSARNMTNGPIQFLKYFDTQVKYRKSLGIYKTEITTRDHLLTAAEVQEMASVADLKGQIILELLLLGLRVGDVCRLEWKWFDVSDRDAPVPLEIMTHKERIMAHTFVSQEFKDLLAKFLPSLDKSCKYLLQSSRKDHLDEDSLNAILKDLAVKARINLRGLLHWHCGRKLFMRTCAESGINSWNAKMMCGKAVEKSIETYINNVQLKEDFKKVSDILRLKKANGNGRIGSMEEVMNLMAAALTELLRPIVARMWSEKQRSTSTLSLIIDPDFEHMEPKKLLEEFLKLTKEE